MSHHPIHKHMSGQGYDAKKAYDKDLTASARLHYLENSEHDKGVSRKSSSPLNEDAKVETKDLDTDNIVTKDATREQK